MTRLSADGEVIVLGGGVAGLAAARELARHGRRVHLIEARGRLGGRIFTRRPAGWPGPVELGAQFVHGGNAALWHLLRTERLRTAAVPPAHWQAQGGTVAPFPDAVEQIERVTGLIHPRKAGRLSFGGYFARYPARVDPFAWRAACRFVQGFEAAPLDQISARSLAGDRGADQDQYFLPGGYDQVVAALARDCRRRGVRISLRTTASAVHWSRGAVRVHAGRRRFTGSAVVVALPLGVLQARAGPGAVRFHPEPPAKRALLRRMRMGHVQRLEVRLRPKAWRRLLPKALRRPPQGFGFIHSWDPAFPVWWSLHPDPVLVAWAGGPTATRLGRLTERARRQRAVASLAEILGAPPRAVRAAIAGWQSWDWSHDPLARGAYSFIAAGADGAGAELAAPVRRTLFYAGEATAAGSEVGTVHGALASGLRAARAVVSAARR